MPEMTLLECVSKFLFDEAELIDRWELSQWEALFTEDAEYLVPPIGVVGAEALSPETALFMMADDREMLHARVDRLMGKSAFCENPRSNVRHLMGSVRILSDEGSVLETSANFCVFRIRRAEITQYIGQCRHTLLRDGNSFKIRRKKVMLDIDVLRGQGGLGIIL